MTLLPSFLVWVLASPIPYSENKHVWLILDGFYAGASINRSSGAMVYNLDLLTV